MEAKSVLPNIPTFFDTPPESRTPGIPDMSQTEYARWKREQAEQIAKNGPVVLPDFVDPLTAAQRRIADLEAENKRLREDAAPAPHLRQIEKRKG